MYITSFNNICREETRILVVAVNLSLLMFHLFHLYQAFLIEECGRERFEIIPGLSIVRKLDVSDNTLKFVFDRHKSRTVHRRGDPEHRVGRNAWRRDNKTCGQN